MPQQLTPISKLPYPQAVDPPRVYADIQSLATAIDSKLPVVGTGTDASVVDGQFVYDSSRPNTQEWKGKAKGSWRSLLTGLETGDWSLGGLANPALFVRSPASTGSMMVLADRGVQIRDNAGAATALYLNPHGGNIFLGHTSTTPVKIEANGMGIGTSTPAVVGLHVSKTGAHLRVQDGSNYIDITGGRTITGNAGIRFDQDVNVFAPSATLTVQTGGAGAYCQLQADTGRIVAYMASNDYMDIQGNGIYGSGGLNLNASSGQFVNSLKTLMVTGEVHATQRIQTDDLIIAEKYYFGPTNAIYMDTLPANFWRVVNASPGRELIKARYSGGYADFQIIGPPPLTGLSAIGIHPTSWQIGLSGSTIALKKEVEPLETSRVWDLSPVVYTTRDEYEVERLGFIAEEVVDILGERSAQRYGTHEVTPEDLRGTVYNFDDRALLAHLVAGMQELRQMVDDTYQRPRSSYA